MRPIKSRVDELESYCNLHFKTILREELDKHQASIEKADSEIAGIKYSMELDFKETNADLASLKSKTNLRLIAVEEALEKLTVRTEANEA